MKPILASCAMAAGLTMGVASAYADPCTAIPDTGAVPSNLGFGRAFSGPVVEVIDGDSLCVAIGPRGGADWVEVRLGDFSAPELSTPAGRAARDVLRRIASGQTVNCVAGLGTYDRIAARCRIDGRSLGDLMLDAGVAEGGNGRAPPRRAESGRPFSTPSSRAPSGRGASCPELRARGGARRGEPGYRAEWDGDNDGIACEPYRR